MTVTTLATSSFELDLAAYRSPEVRVFAGRERGQRVREAAQLDKLERKYATIEVHIPEDVYSVNSSFFLGMFGDSIRELGEAAFREKYRFTGKSIDRVLEDGISEALRKRSPLP